MESSGAAFSVPGRQPVQRPAPAGRGQQPGNGQQAATGRPGEEFTATEARAMDAALDAARLGVRGANPLVGAAVLAADGRVVTGHHRGAGTAHAEVAAIRAAQDAGIDLRTATMLVTLEPCAHRGRTDSCAEAVRAAGIPHLVHALADPNPVAGGGGPRLQAAGVTVRSGLRAEEAGALNDRWLTAVSTGRPFVTAKIAQSLDGRIAAADGTSRWITSAETRTAVHRLRARVDAVVVGTGTVIADNPRLDVRLPEGTSHTPCPVVIGTRELPADSHLAGNPDTVHLRTHDLTAALRTLRSAGFEHVLLEGGARLLSAFVTAGLVDELQVHLAPVLLGETGLAATAGLSVPTLSAAHRFLPDDLPAAGPYTSGPDTVLTLRPAPAGLSTITGQSVPTAGQSVPATGQPAATGHKETTTTEAVTADRPLSHLGQE